MNELIIDANVLVRLLTGEPRNMAETVRALLEAADRQSLGLLVAPLTVAEVVYVLGSFYRWPREDIADGVLHLLASSPLLFLERDVLEQTLLWYRQVRQIHFADAYVAAIALARGHGTVISFDRDFRQLAGITIVDDPSQLDSGTA